MLVKWISEEIARLGEDVHVFTSNASREDLVNKYDETIPKLPSRENINGINIRRFKINYGINSWIHHYPKKIRGMYSLNKLMFGPYLGYWKNGPIIPSMLFAIRSLKPDIILATNNSSFTTYICYLAKRFFSIPVVLMPLTHISESWTFNPVLNKLYNKMDRIITSTEFEKNHLVANGYDQQKINVLGHGIDENSFSGADGRRFREKHHLEDWPIVAYVGRKVEGKGSEHLIDAMRIVWKKFGKVYLVLAGGYSPRFKHILDERLMSLSDEERSKLINIDNFKDDEKKDILAAADIFSMTSNVDSFGLVYLEAWLSELPVIACVNTPQETMIDDGKNGYLVKYADSEELAKKIESLLTNKAMRTDMGQAGKMKVLKDYTLHDYAKNLIAEYQEVLGERTK